MRGKSRNATVSERAPNVCSLTEPFPRTCYTGGRLLSELQLDVASPPEASLTTHAAPPGSSTGRSGPWEQPLPTLVRKVLPATVQLTEEERAGRHLLALCRTGFQDNRLSPQIPTLRFFLLLRFILFCLIQGQLNQHGARVKLLGACIPKSKLSFQSNEVCDRRSRCD